MGLPIYNSPHPRRDPAATLAVAIGKPACSSFETSITPVAASRAIAELIEAASGGGHAGRRRSSLRPVPARCRRPRTNSSRQISASSTSFEMRDDKPVAEPPSSGTKQQREAKCCTWQPCRLTLEQRPTSRSPGTGLDRANARLNAPYRSAHLEDDFGAPTLWSENKPTYFLECSRRSQARRVAAGGVKADGNELSFNPASHLRP